MAAYTTIDNPELYFQTVIYTGDGNTGRSITLDGSEDMQPDLVWIKNRDTARKNNVYDSVRGVTKRIVSDSTVAEDTAGNGLTAFNSDGFTTGSETDTNNDTDGIVAWCFKAGTAFSNDASATSIGDIDSSGSASTTAGFSICSYTGSGSAGDTIKHGLDKTPSFYVVKTRDSTYDWRAYHKGIGETKYLNLNQNVAVATATNAWNDTAPTSSVFSLGDGSTVNQNTDNFIAYCFADVQGFSKVGGSYVGNGSSNGAFIYTGFRPAFVMIRDTGNAENTFIFDNKRDGYNVNKVLLYANTTPADTTTGANQIDLLSNGFKCRSTDNGTNRSGATFIYTAFAEAPFVNSNGVPCNAR